MGFFAAALHTMVVLALSLSLGEILLAGYRKIPLTCPLPPFGDNFLVLVVIQIVAFALFVQLGGAAGCMVAAEALVFPAGSSGDGRGGVVEPPADRAGPGGRGIG